MTYWEVLQLHVEIRFHWLGVKIPRKITLQTGHFILSAYKLLLLFHDIVRADITTLENKR